jgi:hypothetical protein
LPVTLGDLRQLVDSLRPHYDSIDRTSASTATSSATDTAIDIIFPPQASREEVDKLIAKMRSEVDRLAWLRSQQQHRNTVVSTDDCHNMIDINNNNKSGKYEEDGKNSNSNNNSNKGVVAVALPQSIAAVIERELKLDNCSNSGNNSTSSALGGDSDQSSGLALSARGSRIPRRTLSREKPLLPKAPPSSTVTTSPPLPQQSVQTQPPQLQEQAVEVGTSASVFDSADLRMLRDLFHEDDNNNFADKQPRIPLPRIPSATDAEGKKRATITTAESAAAILPVSRRVQSRSRPGSRHHLLDFDIDSSSNSNNNRNRDNDGNSNSNGTGNGTSSSCSTTYRDRDREVAPTRQPQLCRSNDDDIDVDGYYYYYGNDNVNNGLSNCDSDGLDDDDNPEGYVYVEDHNEQFGLINANGELYDEEDLDGDQEQRRQQPPLPQQDSVDEAMDLRRSLVNQVRKKMTGVVI